MAKIAIRADGGSGIGLGHIMRTLVLAKELAKTNDLFYICRTDEPLSSKYKAGINKIKECGFSVELVRENNLLEDLKKIKADCLITDSYDVDRNYFNETKKLFSYTGYIDDMNLLNFNVDFIINQNINAEDLNYKTNRDTKLLLGPKYIMLREEFKNLPNKKINERVQSIMITLGGADPYNFTGKLIDYSKDQPQEFHIVVGPSFTNIEELKALEENNKNIILYFNANMKELMLKCDMAISSCGSTLYELAACGVPTVGVVIADNQLGISNKMTELGLIVNLGVTSNVRRNNVIEALESLINNKSKRLQISHNAQQLIDGNGAYRISEALNGIF